MGFDSDISENLVIIAILFNPILDNTDNIIALCLIEIIQDTEIARNIPQQLITLFSACDLSLSILVKPEEIELLILFKSSTQDSIITTTIVVLLGMAIIHIIIIMLCIIMLLVVIMLFHMKIIHLTGDILMLEMLET